MSDKRKLTPDSVTTRHSPQLEVSSAWISHGVSSQPNTDYLVRLVAYFYSLMAVSRGDSARGRGVQVLHLLNFAWSSSRMPLYTFRPHRKPAAFLAMVVDLLYDLTHRHTERFFEGRGVSVEASLATCLQKSWAEFCDDLKGYNLTRFAEVIDEVIRSAALNPDHSDMPAELARLDLYMTPLQLKQFNRATFFNSLPLHQIFHSLRFQPPGLWEVKREQHPVGGDLRAAIREGYDALWARGVSNLQNPDFVTLFATLPVNSASLFANTYAFQDEDFAVFYARLTDSRRPGRNWSPPPNYVGDAPDDRAHFLFLSAGDRRDSYLRKAQQMDRVGLSSTFPLTIRVFDSWLDQPASFPELYARSPWQVSISHCKQDIAEARHRFLAELVKEISKGQGEL